MPQWPISRQIQRLSLMSQVVLVVVGLVGIGATFRLVQKFGAFAEFSQDAITIQQTVENIANARIAALEYRVAPADEHAAALRNEVNAPGKKSES